MVFVFHSTPLIPNFPSLQLEVYRHMEQPESKSFSNDHSADKQDVLDSPSPTQSHQGENSKPRDTPTSESGTQPRGIRQRLKDFRDAGVDRHIELILAFAIAFFAALQWLTSCQNNASTSRQVSNLITAADRIDDASDSFSRSAAGINSGVNNAVGKLGVQAQKMEESRKSSEAQAQKPLQATIDNFHLEQKSWAKYEVYWPNNLVVNAIPTVGVKITNTGKIPMLSAFVAGHIEVIQDTQAAALANGNHRADGLFHSFVFPNDSFPFSANLHDEKSGQIRGFTDSEARALREGRSYIAIFGFITYRDQIGSHWLRFCDWHNYVPYSVSNASNCVSMNKAGDGKMPAH